MKHVSHITRTVPQWGPTGFEPEDYICCCTSDCPACARDQRAKEWEMIFARFTEDDAHRKEGS